MLCINKFDFVNSIISVKKSPKLLQYGNLNKSGNQPVALKCSNCFVIPFILKYGNL